MSDTHDVIVIGAGAAGLTAAGGCAMLGLRVALVERGTMGGDCLNSGCVPSKALIAAAAHAAAARDGTRFGVHADVIRIDYEGVRRHVAAAITAIAPRDSRTRFEALSVEVIAADARCIDGRTVDAGGRRLCAPRIVIATGSRPRVPDLAGLASVPFLTTKTLWDLAELPRHLAILGGGAVGIELAQAFRRLGATVTVVERATCLGGEDADAAAIVLASLRQEGVRLVEGRGVARVEPRGQDVALVLADGETVTASHLLVAVGREPRVDGLGLAAAGVAVGENGIVVDARRRTSNRHISAIGDCRAGPRLTHLAGEDGSVVVRNIALGWPAKLDGTALPRAIFTDPELAQVGMTEAEALRLGGRVTIEMKDFSEDDRAVTEGHETGFVKTVRRGRRLVGVTIVGRHAGELLLPWSLLIAGRASTLSMASAVVAYPTRSERSKAAAFAAWEPVVFSAASRRWAGLRARMRRRHAARNG